MAPKIVDLKDIRFVLYDMLKAERLVDRDRFSAHSRETFDMALDAAYEMAVEVYWPAFRAMDQAGARLDRTTGKTVVPEAMRPVWKAAREGGWFGTTAGTEYGGQQFPVTIGRAIDFILHAANTAAHMYVTGTFGAARLIESFGDRNLRDAYGKKLYTGQWSGTMALTEPQAGSSLADVKTAAVKAKDGDHYLITGTKCFISSGDHDLAENIIHPVLARLPGAPPGVKGISLFVVPKYRLRLDGSVGEPNDVITGGIEHKMGLRGQATATLNFGENGDCRGWLVGEPNQGLAYMFQLMNEARIGTAVQATGSATNAYLHALDYAHERRQGRDGRNKEPSAPQIPIIGHGEVRRMLLAQKASTEGMFALLAYCSWLEDQVAVGFPGERERSLNLLEILTPICKAYGSEASYASTVLAIQVHGGYGFSEEFPLAQMLRDQKVFSIYEGTNNIQAMDLLGRKVPMKSGAALETLAGEIGQCIARAREIPSLADLGARLEAALIALMTTTRHLGTRAGDPALHLANATPYLQAFSRVVVSWQLLWKATVAGKMLGAQGADEAFLRGKIAAAEYYLHHELPIVHSVARLVEDDERVALDCKAEWL